MVRTFVTKPPNRAFPITIQNFWLFDTSMRSNTDGAYLQLEVNSGNSYAWSME
jgi:hypothetical protein